MKATMRMSGTKMVDLQVTVAMSLNDMADMFVARWRDEAPGYAKSKTKRAILDDIRLDIACSGTEYAGFAIGDNNLNEEHAAVRAVFEKRFAIEFA